jgi:hypothetical protein
MNEIELKKALDTAEKMGFDRGVKTIMLAIFKAIEDSGFTAISYKSLKGIYEEYCKLV